MTAKLAFGLIVSTLTLGGIWLYSGLNDNVSPTGFVQLNQTTLSTSKLVTAKIVTSKLDGVTTTSGETKSDSKPINHPVIKTDILSDADKTLGPIITELKLLLGLSAAQQQVLAQALAVKVKLDGQVIGQWQEQLSTMDFGRQTLSRDSIDAQNGQIEFETQSQVDEVQLAKDHITQLKHEGLQQNQQIYQQQISAVLSGEQMAQYYHIEQQKSFERETEHKLQEASYLLNLLTFIEPAQRDDINQWIRDTQWQNQSIAIGTYGSPVALRSTLNYDEFRTQLRQHIEQTLTTEQLQQYRQPL